MATPIPFPLRRLPMKRQKEALNETLKQEFKKDLELFAYFLVLLNSSSPIRNVELMWAEDLELFDPTSRPRVNTGDALVQIQPLGADGTGRSSPSPSTYFCDLVHGFGAHEEQTCARSDKPAKERCRASGKSQVYPCHVGLTDIAVPVICEGRYLGTLFSGQVLTEPPTPEKFALVRAALEGQPHIDMARLEEAYYRVPIVTTAQLAEMVRMLEVFARYLSNAWKRLEIMSEFQQMREREMALDRRELAEKLLSGHVGFGTAAHSDSLRMLARNVGLERLPDRVLVLRLQPPIEENADSAAASRDFGLPLAEELGSQLTLARVAHLIEDRCRSWPNTLAAIVTPGEVCIFTAQKTRTPGSERLLIEEMAQALLRIARAQGLNMARIGISSLHPQPAELLRAYHEAISALDSGRSALDWFEDLPRRERQPAEALARVLRALQAAESSAIHASLGEFLAAAMPVSNSVAQLEQSRGLLTWACEHLARETGALGAGVEAVDRARERAIEIIVRSPGSFVMAEAFRTFVDELRQRVVQLFGQREQKIVRETQRLVREIGPDRVTIQNLAKDLELSPGHLGRVFSRTMGHTLEEFLIRQKLEMARRLLLDPRLHVSEVSDRCGFCNPAYFASVFKKHMHCTPREYASRPQHFGASESALPVLETQPASYGNS